jgi:hypothetical protein
VPRGASTVAAVRGRSGAHEVIEPAFALLRERTIQTMSAVATRKTTASFTRTCRQTFADFQRPDHSLSDSSFPCRWRGSSSLFPRMTAGATYPTSTVPSAKTGISRSISPSRYAVDLDGSRMFTANTIVGMLVDMIQRGEFRPPEIQRSHAYRTARLHNLLGSPCLSNFTLVQISHHGDRGCRQAMNSWRCVFSKLRSGTRAAGWFSKVPHPPPDAVQDNAGISGARRRAGGMISNGRERSFGTRELHDGKSRRGANLDSSEPTYSSRTILGWERVGSGGTT